MWRLHVLALTCHARKRAQHLLLQDPYSIKHRKSVVRRRISAHRLRGSGCRAIVRVRNGLRELLRMGSFERMDTLLWRARHSVSPVRVISISSSQRKQKTVVRATHSRGSLWPVFAGSPLHSCGLVSSLSYSGSVSRLQGCLRAQGLGCL